MLRMLSALFILCGSGVLGAAELGCSASARSLRLACDFDVKEEFFILAANCIDTNDSGDIDACMEEARDEGGEAVEECDDVFAARLEICDMLDDEPHEPEFGEEYADNFVDPLDIGITVEANPYLPLVQGNVWVYEGTFEDEDDGEEVTEIITVTVTDKVKMIEGIPCLVVNDRAEEDGELIEDTDDWYAQDVDGNVWYCGEISQSFESFEGDDPEEPELVELEGSWKSGREGAHAGILIPFDPEVGDVFRQEVLYGDAEDVVEIMSLEGTESSPIASCDGNCLVTKDFTALEPGVEENKYYVPGIGLIVEVDPDSGERVELIEMN